MVRSIFDHIFLMVCVIKYDRRCHSVGRDPKKWWPVVSRNLISQKNDFTSIRQAKVAGPDFQCIDLEEGKISRQHIIENSQIRTLNILTGPRILAYLNVCLNLGRLK